MSRRAGRWIRLLLVVGVGACATKGLAPFFQRSDQGSALIVTIEGLRSKDGQLLIALFQSAEGFPNDASGALRRESLAISGESMRVRFEDLEPGTYGVSVFHDENANDAMETDFLGRPREGWGVSRDARGFMSAPSFEDSSFEFAGGELETTITLEY